MLAVAWQRWRSDWTQMAWHTLLTRHVQGGTVPLVLQVALQSTAR